MSGDGPVLSATPDDVQVLGIRGRIVALEADVHARLRERGVPHLGPMDLEPLRDREAVAAFVARSRRAAETRLRLPLADGVDPLRAAGYRHERALVRAAWTTLAVDAVLDRLDADGARGPVRAVDHARGHLLDRPVEERHPGTWTAAIAHVAAVRGRELELVAPAGGRRGPAAGDRGGGREGAGAGGEDGRAATGAVELSGRVLAWGSGHEVLAQVPVLHALRARGCEVVQAVRRTDPGIVRRIAPGHPVVPDDALVADGPWSADDEARAAAWRAGVAAPRREEATLVSGLFGPAYAAHLDFLGGPYARAVAMRWRGWRMRFAEDPPAAVLVSYPVPLVEAAVEAGIPVFVLPHGVMLAGDEGYERSIDAAAHVCTVGRGHAALARRLGRAPERVHVTGDPGFAARAARRREEVAGAGPPRRSAAASGVSVVLLCQQDNGRADRAAAPPEVDPRLELEAQCRLAAHLARRGDARLRLRSHPRYRPDPAWARVVAAAGPGAVDEDGGGPLEEAVREATLVLFTQPRSSAVVEASGLGRPVVLVAEPARRAGFAFRDWDLDEWPAIETLADLPSAIDRILDDPAHAADLADRAAAAARAHLAPVDDPAETIAAMIAGTLDRGAERAGDPLVPSPASRSASTACAAPEPPR